MIVEGLVTTRGIDGRPHPAPMGPRITEGDGEELLLRPFNTSTTFLNLQRHPEGVFHLTDDALLLARAAIGSVEVVDCISAQEIDGFVWTACHRYCEFRVVSIDASTERVQIVARIVHRGVGTRPWLGFNRARHAVVEAAILATRVHLLPLEQIEREFAELQLIVDKTGGPDEQEAMDLLRRHVRHGGVPKS